MICLSNSFILLQKLFKKVNLCLKKERKKEKKMFAFTTITGQLIKNLGPRERAGKLGLELKTKWLPQWWFLCLRMFW